jgi:hypothetical protein
MSRFALILASLLIVSPLEIVWGEDSNPTMVVLRIQTDIESNKSSSSSATTVIAPIAANHIESYEVHGVEIQLRVTDRRLDELSIVVSLMDSPESAVDSTTVLVTSDEPGSFEFQAGNDAITGTITLSRIIDPSK